MSKKPTPTELSLAALEKSGEALDQAKSANESARKASQAIAEHTKDCSYRWQQAHMELHELNLRCAELGKRWERVGWLLATCTVTALIAAFWRALL